MPCTYVWAWASMGAMGGAIGVTEGAMPDPAAPIIMICFMAVSAMASSAGARPMKGFCRGRMCVRRG